MSSRYPWILYRYPWNFKGIRRSLADIRGYHGYIITGIYGYLADILVWSYYVILTTLKGQIHTYIYIHISCYCRNPVYICTSMSLK